MMRVLTPPYVCRLLLLVIDECIIPVKYSVLKIRIRITSPMAIILLIWTNILFDRSLFFLEINALKNRFTNKDTYLIVVIFE
jgi:hypothetical protein